MISEKETGIPISKIGSLEFMETLLKKVVTKEGIGEVLALGPTRAAERLGASGLLEGSICDSPGHVVSLDPRLLLYTGLIYVMEPRYATALTSQILGRGGCLWSEYATGKPGAYLNGDVMRAIARRFWGGELAVDFSTYDGKALAAKMVQDRGYSGDCLILCLWMFPMSDSEYTEDHVGDPTIENRMLSAIIGKQVTEAGTARASAKGSSICSGPCCCERADGGGRATTCLNSTSPSPSRWTGPSRSAWCRGRTAR